MDKFAGNYTKIKGVSDIRRLPRLNKIRLGIKAQTGGGKDYPKETSYFVVPPEVAAAYGEEPTELDIMFPVEDAEAVFPQALKYYGSSKGLKCIGNGENASRVNENTNEMEAVECPCEKLESKQCQRRAHLMFVLPSVNLGGVYQIDIGSYHSIVDINSGIDYTRAMIGRFAWVPLKLKRVPRETHGNDSKQIHYTLTLTPDVTLDMLNALRGNTNKILSDSRYALPAAEDSNPVFDDDISIPGHEDALLEGGTGKNHPSSGSSPAAEVDRLAKEVGEKRFFEVLGNCGWEHIGEVIKTADLVKLASVLRNEITGKNV